MTSSSLPVIYLTILTYDKSLLYLPIISLFISLSMKDLSIYGLLSSLYVTVGCCLISLAADVFLCNSKHSMYLYLHQISLVLSTIQLSTLYARYLLLFSYDQEILWTFSVGDPVKYSHNEAVHLAFQRPSLSINLLQSLHLSLQMLPMYLFILPSTNWLSSPLLHFLTSLEGWISFHLKNVNKQSQLPLAKKNTEVALFQRE